ncbi:MAG: carboxypeptidase-like regulatory domain-containing protein [Anaerolineales bacterium]
MIDRPLFTLTLIVALGVGGCISPDLSPTSTMPVPSEAPTGTLALASPTASAVTPTTDLASMLPPEIVQGFVVNQNGPIAGAVVRQKATENKTTTASDGSFILGGLPSDEPVTLTAWAEGYFVGWIEDALAQEEPVAITLTRYYTYDNPAYDWFSIEGSEGSLSCSHCMPCYEEWRQDAHSRSALNERFLSMYNGTDLLGNQSPLTRIVSSRDYGSFPLPPNPSLPYYGPGYKLDFPHTAGNCATCHLPAQAALPGLAYAADPNQASGIELEGVFCEFCHKIGEVTINPDSGLPYANYPGVLSMRLFRPEGEDQLFFGNFDDVTRRVSYLPLEEQSAFCAACHFGVFWDQVIYNSYGEWLDSPYSDPESGQTCQDCHMPAVDYDYFVYPEKGGLTRDQERIFSHTMPGASDEAFLQDAVTMTVDAHQETSKVIIRVELVNDNTGHKVPTDFPMRHLILLVSASNENGISLPLLEGPTIPDWGGIGDPEGGYYGGLPGKGYAQILEEIWTGISPSGAYWNPVRVVSDNRLVPFVPDQSSYTFAAPDQGEVKVTVTLLLRRAFIELMDQKSWQDPDILMEQEIRVLSPP